MRPDFRLISTHFGHRDSDIPRCDFEFLTQWEKRSVEAVGRGYRLHSILNYCPF
jgi:hypothetical protein